MGVFDVAIPGDPMAHGVGSIAVGCVGENSPKYLSRSLRLVQSLRWYGGTMANSDVVLCFVDVVDAPSRVAEFDRRSRQEWPIRHAPR